MIISDKVYGEEDIKEEVLLNLIQSKAVQRLKNISQQGLPAKYGSQPYFSRYEHSIGVCILLRRLHASMKEQIAGLLHDISHPTFSHLIDWVMGDPETQEHQDNHYSVVLRDSDIPEILKKHGFDYEDFTDLHQFTLLERLAPSLCADRIDSCLRDLVAHGRKAVSDEIIKHIKNYYGQIVFDFALSAYEFAHEYSSLQKYSWGNDEHNTQFIIFAEILKRALEKELIKEDDFFGTELEIINKIEGSKDSFIQDRLKLLMRGFLLNYRSSDGRKLVCKFRYIDPEVFSNGNVKRLSELDEFYLSDINFQKKMNSYKCFVEVVLRGN